MGKADDFLRAFFEDHPEAESGELTMQELNKLMAGYQKKANSASQKDFDGLSAEQMHFLLYAPFSRDSILQLKQSASQHLDKVPFFRLSQILLDEICNAGNLKLTPKGNLPVRICELLFEQKLIDWKYRAYIRKVTEDTIPYIWVLKEFLLAEGIVKKRHNALSLTKVGKEFLAESKEYRFLVSLLFFTMRFHWGNFYRVDDDGQVGQLGWAYSLVLLARYGDKTRTAEFYSGKVMDAFPIEFVSFHQAYTVRFFEYFTNWFGLVRTEEENRFDILLQKRLNVSKSTLFDLLFEVNYP